MAKKQKKLFGSTGADPFEMSRSKLALFIECPRCFYLDRRLGVSRPSGYPFTLNIAVDDLLKKEFDGWREKGAAHPLMREYDIDAVPFKHESLDAWRNNFNGIKYLHEGSGIKLYGAIDDVWIKPDGSLIIVDYKATSTTEEISLESEYRKGYKRQLEIYQWLFRQNGFKVDRVACLVFANALKTPGAFDGKLQFDMQVLKHEGDDRWVENALIEAHSCLSRDEIPPPGADCKYCTYVDAVGGLTIGRKAP